MVFLKHPFLSFLAILGTHFHQAAQAASRFISISANAAGSSPKADTHSIWFHGKATMDGLEGLAQALTNVGHEANISQRPNGVLVDVNPKFTEAGPVAIDPLVLQNIADETAGTGKATVMPRQYTSIYIEMPEYAGIIAKAKKELLNEHASKIEVATGLGRKTAKDFIRGDQVSGGGSISVNRRAEKIRDSYRQRIDQLHASEKELKRLFKDFEKDARAAVKEAQRRIDSFKKRRQP